jgi:HSP20 family protein
MLTTKPTQTNNTIPTLFSDLLNKNGVMLPHTNDIALNIYEDSEKYMYKFMLPGLNKDDISISWSNSHAITIEANYSKHESNNYIYSETNSYVKRTLSLPRNIESDSISAKYENGVLYLTLPKATYKSSKSSQISIE